MENNTRPQLHILGLAHTKTNKDYLHCAYTQKVYKLCAMMKKLGYIVYHYGAEGSTPDCTEHVTCVTDAEQAYGYEDKNWPQVFFDFDSTNDFAYKKFNERAVTEINKRKKPRDLLLCSMGLAQKCIADRVGLIPVEMGIGYTGVFSDYKVFESYSWMHYIYGMKYPNGGACDGRFYDCVIPNYFDPADFEFCDKKEDYYLYMGRLITRKGISIAVETTKRIGAKLIIAGKGNLSDVGIDVKKDKHVEYVGVADVKLRSDLMSRAKALFVPTIYLEPFGGVNVEAMFCGTPAITTDWGGFVETVQHGKTGYRCRTIEQFEWAAKHCDELDHEYIRGYAVNNYSTDRVALMYDEYFNQLMGLFGKGFYEVNNDRDNLNWLRKY